MSINEQDLEEKIRLLDEKIKAKHEELSELHELKKRLNEIELEKVKDPKNPAKQIKQIPIDNRTGKIMKEDVRLEIYNSIIPKLKKTLI